MTGPVEAGTSPVVPVFGRAVDDRTRCVHWHSELDVVAIEFACCRRFYPCHTCHEETADHPATTWPVSASDRPAVLCGVCRTRTTIAAYVAGDDRCEHCGAAFNPGCRLHRHLYFAAPSA